MPPGIIESDALDGNKCFTFGSTDCTENCADSNLPYFEQPNRAILTITFDEPTYVERVKFKWMGMFCSQGSDGWVYINGDAIDYSPSHKKIGITNDFDTDAAVTWQQNIYRMVEKLEIAIWGITDTRQFYLDELLLYGATEPTDPEVVWQRGGNFRQAKFSHDDKYIAAGVLGGILVYGMQKQAQL